jgi:hypothetical protein
MSEDFEAVVRRALAMPGVAGEAVMRYPLWSILRLIPSNVPRDMTLDNLRERLFHSGRNSFVVLRRSRVTTAH